jgi:hypothetical protein
MSHIRLFKGLLWGGYSSRNYQKTFQKSLNILNIIIFQGLCKRFQDICNFEKF